MNRKLVKALLAITAATAFNTGIPAAATPVELKSQNLPGQYIYPSAVAIQGRRHPAYQVFAYRAQLPSITIVSNQIVIIDGTVSIASTKLHRISWRQRDAIALEFDVPQGVIDHWLASLLRIAPLDGSTLAQNLCAMVIDYRYLEMRWTQYIPPLNMQSFKDTALQALEAGDLNAAWDMYYSLPRPVAP